MADILPFRVPAPETKAVTCGCGGQTFILVTGENEQPDFIYCVQCQYKLSKVNWFWVEDGNRPGENTDWAASKPQVNDSTKGE